MKGKINIQCVNCSNPTEKELNFKDNEQEKKISFICQCGARLETTIPRPIETSKPSKLFGRK